jgi:hypothetical protein
LPPYKNTIKPAIFINHEGCLSKDTEELADQSEKGQYGREYIGDSICTVWHGRNITINLCNIMTYAINGFVSPPTAERLER